MPGFVMVLRVEASIVPENDGDMTEWWRNDAKVRGTCGPTGVPPATHMLHPLSFP